MKCGIKEVSELTGVSARTLRYYDQIGLLKPSKTSEAGYRYYGERELEILQQILFYKERGMELKQIKKIIYQKDFDIMAALREHLLELEEKRNHMEALIQTVEQTIRSMKGEYDMSDQEKFQAFKERVVRENEEKHGAEIREKYGDEEMDGGANPEDECGRRIVALHKEWLGKTWKQYTKEAHAAIGNLYISDERFKMYYDKEVNGCAKFLESAIRYWVDRV